MVTAKKSQGKKKRVTAKAKATPAAKAGSDKTKATTTTAKKRKKAPAKKTSSVAAKKGKQKAASAVAGQGLPRNFDEHGFVIGSDSAKIVELMLEGDTDRRSLNQKVLKELNRTTRNGKPLNVSSLMSNLLKRLQEKGYTVESTWKLVPPTPASKAAATRRAKKAAKSEGSEKAPVKAAKKKVGPKTRRKAKAA